MPTQKASFKHLRQTKKRTVVNKQIIENIKYLIKKCQKAVETKDKAKAEEFMKKAIQAIDKAVQKKLLKKNNGARKKSSLAKKINSLKINKKEGE